MSTTNWNTAHEIATSASPAAVWSLFRDVASWPRWNAGIEAIELRGPFADGTVFTMKVPGQDAFESRLVDVRENEAFVDETRVGDLVVRVMHRLAPLPGGGTHITYALVAEGPAASQIGPAIAADFPDVLRALVAMVEGRAAAA